MGEPFKNQISPELVKQVGQSFQRNWPAFDVEGFCSQATENLEQYELKERCFRIVEAMEAFFPDDFVQSADIIARSIEETPEAGEVRDREEPAIGLSGWAIMAVQEYVGRNGLQHLGLSLNLLKEMTKRLTSEFGIRYFLQEYQLETLKLMQVWAMDPNEHVRRLVSEGTRPRLPWGMQLKRFIADPSPIIPLLDYLKDDPAEYVRRSVANNLNDISKDHPQIVCKVARSWMKDACENRKRLVKHALRTLIKKGDSDALDIIGFGEVKLSKVDLSLSSDRIEEGDSLLIHLEITSKLQKAQKLLVDYAVHYKKANGTLNPKVFKWKQLEIGNKETVRFSKKQSFKDVSVRKHYSGEHRIEIFVNGKSVAENSFVLDVNR